MIGEELDLLEGQAIAAEYPTTELPSAEDPLHGKGPAATPPGSICRLGPRSALLPSNCSAPSVARLPTSRSSPRI